jgi:type IV secretion system protein VirD4
MLAAEIMQMPPDQQLILRPGMRPLRARKIRWWQEPEFVSRRKPAPKIPQLEVLIDIDDGVRLDRVRQVTPSGNVGGPRPT